MLTAFCTVDPPSIRTTSQGSRVFDGVDYRIFPQADKSLIWKSLVTPGKVFRNWLGNAGGRKTSANRAMTYNETDWADRVAARVAMRLLLEL